MIQMLRPSTYLHPFGIASQQSSSPTPQYRAPTSISTRITTLPPIDQRIMTTGHSTSRPSDRPSRPVPQLCVPTHALSPPKSSNRPSHPSTSHPSYRCQLHTNTVFQRTLYHPPGRFIHPHRVRIVASQKLMSRLRVPRHASCISTRTSHPCN